MSVVPQAYRNYVNLGRLYSIPPWGISAPRPQTNHAGVNLGNLYRAPKLRMAPGWAYFDDGSVFIVPSRWIPNSSLEKRMNIAARIINDSTPKMQEIALQDPHKKRYIIIHKKPASLKNDPFHILVRNARNGQRVSVEDQPFESIVMSLNAKGTIPVVARFKEAPPLNAEHRIANHKALESFRGTLIDGVLQPNVRLGNGLCLSRNTDLASPLEEQKPGARKQGTKEFGRTVGPPDSSPQLDLELREARLVEREQEVVRLQQQLVESIRIQNARSPREISARVSTRAADLKAREQALELKEELLRYKHKAWILEQKLAQATSRPSPIHNAQEHGADVQAESPWNEETTTEPQSDDSDGPHPSSLFDFRDTSPPKALEGLRSRTKRAPPSRWRQPPFDGPIS